MLRKSDLRIALVAFIFVLSFSYNSFSQSVAVPFLTMCPSAEGVGMGNSGVAMIFDDAYGQWFNPGQLGLNSQNNNIQVSYTLPVKWEFASELSYNTFGLSAGYNLSKEIGIPLSLGAGYIRQFMDLGEFTRTHENGQVLGKFKSSESADAFTVAAGFEYWMEIGFGLTYKHVSFNTANVQTLEPSNGTSNVMDIGLLLSAPVIKEFKISDKTSLNANVNAGYSLSNLFDNMNYQSKIEPLPRTARLGYSIGANIHQNYKGTDFELIAIDWSAQAGDLLVKRDTLNNFDYEPVMGNINVWDNLLLLKSENGVNASNGFRLTVAESFKFMSGPNIRISYGISSSGMLKFINTQIESDLIKYISEHFELSYIHTVYNQHLSSIYNFDKVNNGLNLKFRNIIID